MARRALLVLLVAFLPAFSGCLEGDLVGEPVPRFELVTSEGARVNESTYLGRWLVLDLMATWCRPCELEIAHLREVQRVHGDRVVILSVGADPTETTVDLERFGQKHGAAWPYALDYDGSVGRAMQMRIIPKLVVVDPEGVVRLERQGEVLPAAITRVIDPSAAPPEGNLPAVLPALVGLLLGVLAPFNPYRKFHRDAAGTPAWLLALLACALVAGLAWSLAGLFSTRATYGSLAGGVATLVAALWWLRARRREGSAPQPNLAWETGDRLYEWLPHLGLALVLALQSSGIVGFAAPTAGFLAGVVLGSLAWRRLPPQARELPGVVGLVLAGGGLLAFGARVLLV